MNHIIIGLAMGCALALGTARSFAIEGLKLTIPCPDVVLSWPSVEGEYYIVQFRETLSTNTPWVTLTNYLPAETGTNLTTFTHSNRVDCPVGQVFGMMNMSSSGSGTLSIASTLTLAERAAIKQAREEDRIAALLEKCALEGREPFDWEWKNQPPLPPSPEEVRTKLLLARASQLAGTVSLSEGETAEDDPPGPEEGNEPEGGGGGSEPGTGFYQVARIGVHVVGLTNLTNGIVSDTIYVPFEAANETGFLRSVSVLVDGARYRGAESRVSPNIAGSLLVDTSFLENGDHTVQVQAIWLNPDAQAFDSYVMERFSDSFTLSVSNMIYFPEWEDEVGELGFAAYFAKTVFTNADWQIDLFDVNTNHIQTLTGQTTNGIIEAYWNLVDTNGVTRTNVAVDPEFASTITVSAAGSPSTTKKPKNKQLVNDYPEHGHWVIAHQDEFKDMVNSNMYYSAIYSFGSIGAQFGGAYTYFPTPGHPEYGQTFPLRTSSTNQPLSIATILADQLALERLLTNSGARNFFYVGHGDPVTIAGNLDSERLSSLLRRHYYRFVFLDGCNTANGSLPAAFGINFNSPKPLSYFQQHGIRPRVFLGNNITVRYGTGGNFIDPQTGETRSGKVKEEVPEFLTNFEFYWNFNYDVFYSVYHAMLDTPYIGGDWDTGQHLRMFGYDGLRVDDYNWKYQWAN